ncbi:Uropathogenic specific protein [Xenorhabdus beddingii]|uniref:Uropathogenic specific protein n=1 Tax=Xenorhabdus beddingii TaxID=40578 RepID=A0A1Y2SQ96_9GAMM|nr:S-type pyocin domain-containing protein [Xenorhabdus beddingii]OTA20403.1 Uropathogenic specific protein [Xenorhabdus beddingii]
MSDTGRLDCVPCNKFRHWLEFQLLDNQGKPLIGIPYHLKSRDGVIHAHGVTDGQGILREENLSSLPMTLHVDAQKLADQLVEKSTVKAVATEKMPGSSPAIMPGALSDGLPKLEGWTEAALQTRYYADANYPGVTVMPAHNRRHVIAVERIAKPVFAKSCLQPAGCTDAGTDTEPHTHFGQMQVFQPVPATQPASEKSTPWYLVPIVWLSDQVVPSAQAFALPVPLPPPPVTGNGTGITDSTAASTGRNTGEMGETRPVLSQSEQKTLDEIKNVLTRDYQLASLSAITLGMMIRNVWNGSDEDFLTHDILKKIADKKGTAPTRVRYHFVENPQTGQLTAVGYHTGKESGLEQTKVRHVQHNKSLNRYEFWEDDATSPTLIWSLAGELSRHNIDNYAQQNSAVNTKVAVLDPKIATQTPGLPIPDQGDWRDGAYINPQQDPDEIGGNSTSTPRPDAKDHGPTVLGTPIPEEKDFRDYILIFPVSNIPALYVYLSKSPTKFLEVDVYRNFIGRPRNGHHADHMPSAAAVKLHLKRLYPNLKPNQLDDLAKDVAAIIIPADVHRKISETYGGRNKSRIERDSLDLRKALDSNFDAEKSALKGYGATEQELEEARAKMHEINEEKGLYKR